MAERNKILPPFSVVLIMIALSIAGIASFPRLNIQYTPTSGDRTIDISFQYPDASSEAVEAEATSKIEGAVAGISGVSDITSLSSKGSGVIEVKFRKGTDMDAARFETASAIRNIWSSLPDGMTYPETKLSGGSGTATLAYLVKGPIPSREIAKFLEDHVAPSISSIPGVDAVSVSGGVPFQWVITFDAGKTASAGITASDIAEAFNDRYGSSIVGTAKTGDGLLTVRLKEETDDDFGSIPVKNVEGRIVHLRDIATWRYEESQPRSYYRVNGLNTVALSVGMSSTSNLLSTASAVKDKMVQLEQTFPSEITASIAYDSSDYVSKELSKIFKRTAMCVVILLLFVFLISRSWRYMLVVISTLAVNILAALSIYALAGLQIHIYTLAGITVSLGIVIDTSIVMIDHYSRWKDMKAFPAVLSAVATTVGALLVVLLLPEKDKANLVDFIWVIVINLALSLLISYLFIPSLMEYIPVQKKEGARSVRRARRAVKRNRSYEKRITRGVRFRWLYVIAIIAAFGIPTCLIPESKATWKPYQMNRNRIDNLIGTSFALFHNSLDRSNFYREPTKQQLIISAGMLEGCTVGQLNDVIKAMENYLAGFDEISVFTTSIASYDDATITVEFKPEYEHTSFPAQLKSEVTSMAINFGGANWSIYGINDNYFNNYIVSRGKSSSISLSGYSYQELREYAGLLCDYLSENKRVSGPEIWSGGWSGQPSTEFVMDYDFGKTTAAGVNPYQYYNILSSLLYESEIGTSSLSGEMASVVLKSSEIDAYDLWHVLNSPVEVGDSKITLSNVGSIQKKRTGITINRHNQVYTLAVCYDFSGSYRLDQKVAQKAVDYMNSYVLPVGFKAEMPDYTWDSAAKAAYLWLILLIIAVIYVILAITFESLRYPLAVILMIPMSFIGAFLVFGLSNLVFDQGGFAGFVMLSGIVVNAGIYIVTTYQSLLESHKSAAKTLSGRVRLYTKAYSRKIQPISLTLLSTILGLIPFLSDGPDEVFWFDFAIGTIAGLLFSVIAILRILPVFCVKKR